MEKCGAVEDCERVGNLVNRLAQLDEDLDKDRRAVDQTWREHGTDLSEELALEKYFKNMYKLKSFTKMLFIFKFTVGRTSCWRDPAATGNCSME